MSRAKKNWHLAEYWANSNSLEVAQSALLEAGAIGLEIDDGLGPEGQKKYHDNQIRLVAYFELSENLAYIEACLKSFLSNCNLDYTGITWLNLEEQDWQGNFVRTCTTFKIEPNIYIVPSFEIDKFIKNPLGDLYIEMDPENAFGTGQHQTTKLCLTAIYGLVKQPAKQSDLGPALEIKQALDVGTGSGILAILLKKLGVERVQGTENDSDALITAAKNANKNQVNIDYLLVSDEHSYSPATYDLIVANILAPVLINMAPNLAKSLRPKAKIILSGILLSQAESVIKAYQACGLKFIRQDQMDDWCALLLEYV